MTLPPDPISVRRARMFIRQRLQAIGLNDVAETAALAGSELATNAVLHARTEFTVRVTPLPDGTARVSIYDASTVLPRLQPPPQSMAVGRGLPLVAEIADTFGAEHTDDTTLGGPGKEVWFEVGAGRMSMPRPARYLVYEPAVADLRTMSPVVSDALVEVHMLNAPLHLFARELARHRELMREMALIALDEKRTHGVPRALTELAAELEVYRGVGATTDAVRDAAIARGEASIDLVYRLPPAIGPACARLDELLDEADIFCRNENLLTIAAPPEGLAARRWYLRQIVSQIGGAAPEPWTGSLA